MIEITLIYVTHNILFPYLRWQVIYNYDFQKSKTENGNAFLMVGGWFGLHFVTYFCHEPNGAHACQLTRLFQCKTAVHIDIYAYMHAYMAIYTIPKKGNILII